jgi:hypothetical protein
MRTCIRDLFDSGYGMEIQYSDPRSGINIPDPQHCSSQQIRKTAETCFDAKETPEAVALMKHGIKPPETGGHKSF